VLYYLVPTLNPAVVSEIALRLLDFSVMSIREALIAVVALVIMAPPAIAENANNLKYALECGAAKITPPDNDSDPIYKTKIAVTDKVIYVVHYAASGETYIRNEQYRDLRFWGQEKPTTGPVSQSSVRTGRWSALSDWKRDASG
jgi:hypothetical protein